MEAIGKYLESHKGLWAAVFFTVIFAESCLTVAIMTLLNK